MGCLIFPKLYTVVFKPNNNTKEKVLKPHRSRATFTVPDTPPNSVAVGIADGALLGPYQHMVAPLEVKVQFPEDITVKPACSSTTSNARRHPTWSHELHMMDRRPRSRSLSVSRSTQTREELEHIREMKRIKFTVECVEDNDVVKEEMNECEAESFAASAATGGNILKVPNTDL